MLLNEHAQSDKRPLLIPYKAQRLTHADLENLRLVTNLQMSSRLLLQVIILSQKPLCRQVQDSKVKHLLLGSWPPVT